jgi:hypothetical protein
MQSMRAVVANLSSYIQVCKVVDSYRVHNSTKCSKSNPISGSKNVPRQEKISAHNVSTMRPIKINCYESGGHEYLYYFGLSMSDGQKEIHPGCNKEHTLPENITRIEMFIQKSEFTFHSMVFYGNTTLRIGSTFAFDQKYPAERRGRQETFVVPAGERLLGC